jgi:[ribosomal protein S5]-alanine N-acetyltransferase
VQEGFLRERWIVGDEVSDTALFGLLRRGWAGAPCGEMPAPRHPKGS